MSKKKNQVQNTASPFMKYSGLAFQLAATIALGIYGGQWIDEKIGFETPIVTILLTILLFIGFMFKLYKELIN